MKQLMKYAIKTLLVLSLAIILGAFMLVTVFCIPVQNMKDNVQRSIEIYDFEEAYPQLMAGYKMSQLDNITDSTMLLSAIFSGTGNVIKDAMQVYHEEYKEMNQTDSLTDYANDIDGEMITVAYPRYWHGYLVILKLLLLLFDVADIRVLNMFFEFSLLLCVIWMMWKRGMEKYTPVFIFAILLMNPLTIPLSFQFSTVSYIMLCSSIVVLYKEEWKKEERFFFFLIVGIITAYFDFLTFPLVGLYFPVILLLMKENSWKDALKIVIICSIAWIIGYVGMWCGKWVIGSVLTGDNLFADVMTRVDEYNVLEYEDVSSFYIIFKTIRVLIKWPIVIGSMVIILYLIRYLRKEKEHKAVFGWIFPFALIAVSPFVWYVATGIHSYFHYWFTYRTLCVSILAFLTGLYKIGGEKQ